MMTPRANLAFQDLGIHRRWGPIVVLVILARLSLLAAAAGDINLTEGARVTSISAMPASKAERKQVANVLRAWPALKQWLPGSFYLKCRDFCFAN
jgi:hypothetical protein